MTVRAVLAAWVAAAALFAAAVAWMIAAAGPAPPVFRGAPVAVIGSSLMHNAVPNQPDRQGLLGNGQSHWRVGINAITQDDTAALVAHAIDEHAQVALVEANVLLFDPARNRVKGRCDQPAAGLRRAMKLLQLGLTEIYVRLFGKAGELDEDPGIPEFEAMPGAEKLRGIYPLVVRGPCDIAAWKDLASRAHARGTMLVLLIPPRSTSADHLLGPIQKRMIGSQAKALGKTMGAAIFVADAPWPDAEFVDGEHLNAAGRTHFIAALRHWWAAPH